jgi:hypothetical protein
MRFLRNIDGARLLDGNEMVAEGTHGTSELNSRIYETYLLPDQCYNRPCGPNWNITGR